MVAQSGGWELVSVQEAGEGDGRFLLKRLKGHASAAEAVGLRNEWEIVSRCRLGCMLNPVRFLGSGLDSAILFGPVEGVVSAPGTDIDRVLAAADAVVEALGEVHAAGIIHGDLQPANLLFTSEKVYLVDFSGARATPREQKDIESVWTLRRNLNYIAPEQTGRLNRTADYRADYYSFGVMLYRWLTGRLPFAADHPLELVYAHLTLEPVRPDRIRRELPPFLADITMKLLAKDPDHRYQSGEGLRADIEIARGRGLRAGVELPQAGTYDVPYQFAVTHKLYGREAERETLLHSYQRACRGEREMILIAGYSGIGKTSLIRETYIPVTRQKAYFVAGKFDQLQRTRPYSAWIEALRKLMVQVLAEPDQQLLAWRQRIGAAIGAQAGVLAPMVPELTTLLGPLEPPPDLPPTEALHRFNDTFRRFLGCFCQPEQPLAIFLDDLQWIDGASLNLLELLLRDPDLRYLFPIGAYRDNEIYPGHPLPSALDRLKREGVFTLTELTLQPLDDEAVALLVADTFALPPAEVGPLAAGLLRKTAGNPFFLWQTLQALRSRGDVRFDRSVLRWTWHPDAIERLAYADNVLDLMQARFQELPEDTRAALALAACLGARFELETLGMLRGEPPHVIFLRLQAARDAEFIVPESTLEIRASHLLIRRFRFLHDRLQEAAYRSIPPEQVAATHHRIARLLLADSGAEAGEERVFEIADHLNRAVSLVVTRADGLELARVNLAAACKARAAAAFDAALRYAEFGMARLPEDLWETERELARSLFRCRGDLEYLNGRFEPAEQFVRTAIANEPDPLHRADFLHMLVVQYTLRALYPEAIETAREGLRLLGVELPDGDYERTLDQELERVYALLGERPLSVLAELPAMADPEQMMVMTLLTALGPPCYRSHPRLWSVIVAQEVRRCLEFGNVASACYSYPAFGGLLVHVGRGTGSDCAVLHRVTIRLMARFDQPADASVGYLMMGSSLAHWFAPLSESNADYLNAYRIGLDSGNLQYAAYAFGHSTYCRFYQGVPLVELIEEARGHLEFCRTRGNQWGIDLIEGALRVFATLLGADGCGEFCWDGDPESAYLARCDSHRNLQVWCIYHLLKTEALWHLGRPAEAARSLAEAGRRVATVAVQGLLPASQFHLFRALLLAHAPDLLGVSEHEARSEITAIRRRFDRWAGDCPANFLYLCRLLGAEEARLRGDVAAALQAYDDALQAAREQGFHQRAGLIAVRAALFWDGYGKRQFAEVYRRQAEFDYQAWQAGALLRNGGSGAWSALPGSAGQGTAWVASPRELDQQALLAAAQALSKPISLDELMQSILQTTARMSGAQRTVLMLQSASGWTVAADTAAASSSGAALDQLDNLPRSVLHYVARSHSLWRLTQAVAGSDTLYRQDNYFRLHRPLSALCLPLLYLGELGGLLYLEQFELGDAFDVRHTQALEFIAGQAAIAIRNARLFAALQDEIVARQRVEEALQRAQEVAHLGSWTLEPGTQRMQATLELLRLLGLPAGSGLSLQRYRAFVHPEDRPLVQAAWDRAITDRAGLELEYRIIVGSDVRWVQEKVRLSFDAGGAPAGGLGTVLDVTQRKQREAEYRAVIETTSDGFLRLDAAGCILEVNDAYLSLSGYTRDELLQMRVADLEAVESPDEVSGRLAAAAREGHDRFETRHRRKDGPVWPVEVNLGHYPVGGEAGREGRYFCFARDITERKRAEVAVSESRNLLRTVIDTAPVRVFWKDRDLRYLGCNPVFARDAGKLHPDELLGQDDYRQPWADQAEIYRADDRAVIESGIARLSYEEPQTAPDGRQLWLRASKVPLRAPDGETIGVLGVYEDITEQKEAEAALRKSEAFVRDILDSVNNTIAVIDGDGAILAVNECWRQFALENGAMAGQPVPATDLGSNYLAVCRAAAGNGADGATQALAGICGVLDGTLPSFSMEYACPSPTQMRWFSMRVTPLGQAGRGAVIAHIEITALKLVEEQLREAKRMAEAASQAKSRFLAMMSHEIRTPMTAVLGLSQLALQTELTDQQRDYLRKIDLSARGLLGIINDILDVSKIESGQLVLESRPFRLAELVAEVESQMRVESQAKGLEFRVTLEEGLSRPLMGDAMRLRQVLTNLLSNAIKFTPQGQVALRVSAVDRRVGRQRLRFEVCDTGIGIPRHELANLFEAFRQVDSSITRRYGGTGLGLTICKQLVTLMDGKIAVRSRLGRGSTFSVELCFELADDLPSGVETDAGTEAAATDVLAGRRVLLAEDSELNGQVAAELLQRLGIRVERARDGREAVQKVASSDFDAVLMDVHMPELDGFAATREIRAMPGRTDLPIIALTADAFSDDRRRCLQYGMNDHVAKPFEIGHLAAVLARWVRPERCPAEAARSPSEVESAPCPADLPAPAADANPAGWPVTGPESGTFGGGRPSIDVDGAVRRLGGDRALYQRCVRNFLDQHDGSSDRLRRLSAAGRIDELRHLAHRLKGEAGTAGAAAVVEAAAVLDRAIRDRRLGGLSDLVGRLAAALEADSVLLRVQLGETPLAPRDGAAGMPDLAGAWRALSQHLADNNLEARRDFERLAALLTAPDLQPWLRHLGTLIAGLKFAEALEVLERETPRPGWQWQREQE